MLRNLAIAAALTLFAAPAFAQTTEMSPAPHAMGSMKADHGMMNHSMKGGTSSHSMKSGSMNSSHAMKGDSMKGDMKMKASPAPK